MEFLLAIMKVCVAPLVGAYKVVREEMARPAARYPSLALLVKDSIRLYFAPLVGAVRETKQQLKYLAKHRS